MTDPEVEEIFKLARSRHQAGDLSAAEILYRQVLARQPSWPGAADALFELGNLYAAAGIFAPAVASYRQAIALRPDYPQALNNLASALQDLGQLPDAIQIARQAVALRPNWPELHNTLGGLLKDTGELRQSEESYRQALQLRPDFPDAMNNLANLMQETGRTDESMALLNQAIAIQPGLPEAHYNLGNALARNKQNERAVECFRSALALRPDWPAAHGNLATALLEAGRVAEAIDVFTHISALYPNSAQFHWQLGNALDAAQRHAEAVTAFQHAVALEPNNAIMLNNLGNALKEAGRVDDAIACFQKAIAIAPRELLPFNNLGAALLFAGRLDEACECYAAGLKLQPDYPPFHWNLGQVLLTQGKLREGWKEYAWRWRVKQIEVARPDRPQPLWEGAALNDRRILVHAEQGFGDTIQFVRFLPEVARRGGKIILECQPALIQLLKSMASIADLVAQEDPPAPADLQFPLMDLPLVLDTTLETIPANVPYLFAEPNAARRWKDRIENETSPDALKVGLVWAGKPTHRNDRNRSLSLAEFFPLANIPGVSFFSLQKGDAANQSRGPLNLIDWTNDLNDFSDTAGLLANLDLLISADTSVAHLAGAMGRRVWVLLPAAPDWRWMMNREDSPWYPSMRLFRQTQRGNWSQPMRRVLFSLRALSQEFLR